VRPLAAAYLPVLRFSTSPGIGAQLGLVWLAWIPKLPERIFNNLRSESKSSRPDHCKVEAVFSARDRRVEKRV